MSEQEQSHEDFWQDDLLERRRYADFLTRYIDSKVQADQPGMVMALDAAWGLGKTFFVTRWANELRSNKRAVVVFDAWKNDYSEDPVISFMAELRSGLTPTIDKLPLDEAVGKELKLRSTNLIGKLRKATFSTAKVLAAGAIKKFSGTAIDDLVDAWTNGVEDVEEPIENEKDEQHAKGVIDKGLDNFFETALQGHSERAKAVTDFRESLQELLVGLRQAEVMHGPLYVFIDELDRCRPDYAIKLLEGIKHLFSVEGVVFVVSTNLDQLSKAVGAVYGANFDGFLYLKRFFDFEYELPQPTRISFIKSQIVGTFIEQIKQYSGLDWRNANKPNEVADGFAAISEAMRLDLRSIKRILTSTEVAIANLPTDKPFACLWIFFLATLKYKHQQEFQKIAHKDLTIDEFKLLCNGLFIGGKTVPGISFEKVDNYRNRRVEGDYSLAEVLAVFYRATLENVDWILRSTERNDLHQAPYPTFLLTTLLDGWQLSRGQRHPIEKYASLVSMAGQVV